MTDAERVTWVEDYVHEIYTSMEIRVTIAEEPGGWDRIAGEHPGPETTFGWTTPYDDPDSTSGLGLALDPALIVQQSADLDDEEFEHYVSVIEYVLNNHITLYDDHDTDERRTIIDNVLYDKGPGSMQLLSEVQMAALDRRRSTS